MKKQAIKERLKFLMIQLRQLQIGNAFRENISKIKNFRVSPFLKSLITSIVSFIFHHKIKLIVFLAITTIIIAIYIVFIFWWAIPQERINLTVLTDKERLDSENAIRTTLTQTLTTLTQAVGGTALIIGLFFTWKNLEVAQKNLETGQKALRTAEEKQVTERFGKAIEHLGDKSIQIRLGGIYALERIAKDSDKDYWPIVEILTAFIREESPWPPKPEKEAKDEVRIDIQAALSVLGRRIKPYGGDEPYSLDLRKTDLRKANLVEAQFQGANLTGANLQGANLKGANLQETVIIDADLQSALLIQCNLEKATLMNSNFKDARLMRANCRDALALKTNFEEAFLLRAEFQNANLAGATFKKAKLEGAQFQESTLTQVTFDEAILQETNFRESSIRECSFQKSRFWKTNLRGIDLTSSRFDEAIFVAVDLEEVFGVTEALTTEQIQQASSNTSRQN